MTDVIPMTRDVKSRLEEVARNARIDTANMAADIAQFFPRSAAFEEADPRIFAQHNQAIADEIRNQLGQFNPPAAA